MEEDRAEKLTRDALPNPWTGEYNIEYWLWDGVRLTPTTLEGLARLHEYERTAAARCCLKELQARERRETRHRPRRRSTLKTWWEDQAHLPRHVNMAERWLWGSLFPKLAARTGGARAERSSTTRSDAPDTERPRRF